MLFAKFLPLAKIYIPVTQTSLQNLLVLNIFIRVAKLKLFIMNKILCY